MGNIYYNEHMIRLRDTLARYGYELQQTSNTRNLKNFAFLIQTESTREQLPYPKEKLILFIQEPPSVRPDNYSPNLHNQFSKIITWRHDLVDNKRYFQYYHSQPDGLRNPAHVSLKDKEKFCVLMNANKTSRHPDELYSKRIEMIRFFEQHAPQNFDLYGNGWNSAQFKSHRGFVPDGYVGKVACLKKYKFCICYENMHSIQGYVTEKIFDCMRAGCVPIYWGASNITDYVPQNCFIPRERFGSNEELYTYLKNMPDDTYQTYLDTMQNYLKNDPRVDLFSVDHFVDTFMQIILNIPNATER